MIPSVAAVILDSDRKILLQQKQDNQWSLPAGMIEPSESPGRAIVREVEEETGLIVNPAKLLGVFSGERFRHTYANGHQVEYTVVLFSCHIMKDTGRITDSETRLTRYFEKTAMPPLALPYPVDVLFAENTTPCWN